jgi:hypothetical protein
MGDGMRGRVDRGASEEEGRRFRLPVVFGVLVLILFQLCIRYRGPD